MFNQLQRAINLSQKTGDKLIVFDSRNPKNSYVLIPFDEYERDFYENCDCCHEGECGMFDEMGDEYFDDKGYFEKNEKIEEEGSVDSSDDFGGDIVDSSGEYGSDDDYFSTNDDHLTEEEQIDKINRDLSKSIEADLSSDDTLDKLDFLEGNFDRSAEDSRDRASRGNNWNIPRNIKASAEEVIEEDRHYLEEITF